MSCFRIFRHFKLSDRISYDQSPTYYGVYEDETEQTHAMLMVGVRKVSDSNFFFLLQTWCQTKPFPLLRFPRTISHIVVVISSL